MNKKTEVLVHAVMHYNRALDPLSETYRLNNPLLIKSFARPGKHETDEQGRRIFPSFGHGYQAALFDMDLKVTGKSRAGLHETDQLQNLLRVYGLSEPAAQEIVVTYLRKALSDISINKNTPLEYFLNA